VRNIKEDDRFIVSEHLDRRRFLQLLALSGAVVGCQRLTPTVPGGTPTTSSATLTLDLRFGLENAAVTYSPHPRGCDVTSIRGSVKTADGSPVAGIVVRVWAEDVNQAITLITDAGGFYSCDVASSTSNDTFYVQLTDQTAMTLFSDVIVAQAASSCNLNLMTVNFVSIQ
jgi:hypothetical protein